MNTIDELQKEFETMEFDIDDELSEAVKDIVLPDCCAECNIEIAYYEAEDIVDGKLMCDSCCKKECL